MSDFTNNLRAGDEVLDTLSGRTGVVLEAKETKRNIRVRFKGAVNAKRLDVMKVRLVVDGKPEDAAPVDGEPPVGNGKHRRPASDAVGTLQNERDDLKARQDAMNAEYKQISDRIAKIDNALAILA